MPSPVTIVQPNSLQWDMLKTAFFMIGANYFSFNPLRYPLGPRLGYTANILENTPQATNKLGLMKIWGQHYPQALLALDLGHRAQTTSTTISMGLCHTRVCSGRTSITGLTRLFGARSHGADSADGAGSSGRDLNWEGLPRALQFEVLSLGQFSANREQGSKGTDRSNVLLRRLALDVWALETRIRERTALLGL